MYQQSNLLGIADSGWLKTHCDSLFTPTGTQTQIENLNKLVKLAIVFHGKGIDKLLNVMLPTPNYDLKNAWVEDIIKGVP